MELVSSWVGPHPITMTSGKMFVHSLHSMHQIHT